MTANSPPETPPTAASMLQYVELMQALQPQNKSTTLGIADVVMKIAVAICTAGIVWLVTSVSDLQNQMTALTIKQSVTEKAIGQLDHYTQQPRFTHDDFLTSVAPMEQKVERHNAIISNHQSWISSTDNRLAKLESRLDTVLEKLDDMSSDIKVLR